MDNKMNNFSLGSTTSMVYQNTTQSSIPYPYGMNPYTTLFLPPEHKHCISASISYFHAQKYHSEIGCHNIKKRILNIVSTPRYLPYMHMVNIQQQSLEHLPYWQCGGAGDNRIDIKWPKRHMLQKYLRCYRVHTRHAESQVKQLAST